VSSDPDAEEGLERLRAVARSNPRSTAFVALAHALCDRNREREAEEVCRQGLLQHPHLVTGEVALGRALIGRGRWAEAREVLVAAARSNPDHGDAFRLLGDLVLHEGDRERARILLEYAEELMPSDGRVAELLSLAGGKPWLRPARPSTDFEHTQVKDGRALADHMHEDPPTTSGARGAIDEDRTPVVEPLSQLEPVTPIVEAPVQTAVETALPPPRPPRWRLAAHPFRALALAAAAGLVLVLVLRVVRQPPETPQPNAGSAARTSVPASLQKAAPDLAPLRQAILEGSPANLEKVRALGQELGLTGPAHADLAAMVAFADALLAAEWGSPLGPEVDRAADIAARARPTVAVRTATFEAARAIAVAAAGRLPEARAAAERALAASASSFESRFAAGRIKLLHGELGAARVDLERALTSWPGFTLAALDQAAGLIEAGEASTAASQLEKMLVERPGDLRAQLLLAEARRAAARPVETSGVLEACGEPGATSSSQRALCSFGAAADARLRGDRSLASRYAREAIAAGVLGLHSARATAQAALILASLGEVDAASEALLKIRDHVGTSFAPRVWAEVAIALGRGEKVAAASLSTPTSPEARLTAARMAFAQGGPAALSATLGRIGAAAVEYDADLQSFAALATEGRLTSRVRLDLERRVARGSPVAAYVLGRNALAAGQRRTAARGLQRALKGHGDACEAARLLMTIDRKYRPSSVATDARIARTFKGRNSGCVYLER
jgi:tetratricopeptide (TPR) repeat protein